MTSLQSMLLVVLSVTPCVAFAEAEMRPFAMDWRDNAAGLVDLSSFLDAPAGKNGAIRISDGHLVTPEGRRFRIWGVNFTGAACFPSKADAPVVATHLARFGINCVRFHFLDSNWSPSLFVRGSDNTRSLDPNQLNTLDYFIAELKKRGIYTNLNLNVGRTFRKGDGVTDYEYLGFAKVVNYFDEQVQMLHREYARQLLTHRNAYTGNEYRHEPAVAIVELVNENSIVEAWFSDRLLGRNTQKNPGTWTDITASYAEELTKKYNDWLRETFSPEDLSELRKITGVVEGELIPRLTKAQFKDAPTKRFHTEAAFYVHLEQAYFKGMAGLDDLDLSGTQITGAGLEHLKGLTTLQWLAFHRTKVTDAGLAHLKGLIGLGYLDLSGTQVTDAGLAHLKGLTRLQSLNLSVTKITDASLEHLKGLTGLNYLDLGGTQVTDAGLEHLKGLTGLQTLWLNDAQITGAGLEHLKGLTGLQELQLSNAQITDAGLEHLKGLTSLRSLNLSGTQVTDAGIQQLKQSLPNLTIVRDQAK